MNIPVLIIEDHPLAREGLTATLDRDPGIDIVGEAESGEEGLRLAAELEPSVVILDLNLPDMDGVEVLTRLRSALGDVRTLILTASEQTETLVQGVRAGAAGYLSKRARPEEIRQAVIAVSGGGSVISPALAGQLLREYSRVVEDQGTTARPLLTPRERDILRLLAQGHTDLEIASELYLSRRTVQYHLASVRRKTGLTRRSQLARWVDQHAS